MRTIWKYPVNIKTGKQTVRLHQMSNLLSFQLQSGIPYLWVEVNTDYPEIDFHFEIFGTGFEMSACDNLSYIGTVVDETNFMVWHLYLHL